jgi:hypothetical protein
MSKGQGKLSTKNKTRYINKTSIKACFIRAYLGWSSKPVAKNFIFNAISHLNIAVCVQKYLEYIGPKN